MLKGENGETLVVGVREMLLTKGRLVFTEDPYSLDPDRHISNVWDLFRTEGRFLDLPPDAVVVLPVGDPANSENVEEIKVFTDGELIVRVRFRTSRALSVFEDPDTGQIVVLDTSAKEPNA